MSTGRYLGIDFGTKRIGLAISDENARLAFPKQVILNDKNTFLSILDTVKSENIKEIVVGESMDFDGKSNPVAKYIEEFISNLGEQIKLPIHKQKEFLTSVEARRYKVVNNKSTKKNSNSVDAGAAALILQRYLDKNNK